MQVKEQLKDVFGLSITTDGWTSVATRGYYTVTAHWLDPDFVMQRLMLGVERLEGSDTSQAVGKTLTAVFERFEIKDKVFHATTDNAEPLVKAITDLHLLHTRCFAHSLQLIVQKALDSNLTLIAKVRSLVGSFHHSSLKSDALTNMQMLLEKKAAEKEKRAEKPVVKLVADTPTRWHSTYLVFVEDGLQAASLAAWVPELPLVHDGIDDDVAASWVDQFSAGSIPALAACHNLALGMDFKALFTGLPLQLARWTRRRPLLRPA